MWCGEMSIGLVTGGMGLMSKTKTQRGRNQRRGVTRGRHGGQHQGEPGKESLKIICK